MLVSSALCLDLACCYCSSCAAVRARCVAVSLPPVRGPLLLSFCVKFGVCAVSEQGYWSGACLTHTYQHTDGMLAARTHTSAKHHTPHTHTLTPQATENEYRTELHGRYLGPWRAFW